TSNEYIRLVAAAWGNVSAFVGGVSGCHLHADENLNRFDAKTGKLTYKTRIDPRASNGCNELMVLEIVVATYVFAFVRRLAPWKSYRSELTLRGVSSCECQD